MLQRGNVSPIIGGGAVIVIALAVITYLAYKPASPTTPAVVATATAKSSPTANPTAVPDEAGVTTATAAGALYVTETGTTATVYTVSTTGTKKEIFSFAKKSDTSVQPSISADGTKIAYTDEENNLKLYSTVTKQSVLLKASSSDENNMTKSYSFDTPIISPDGKYVAATMLEYENREGAIVATDGSSYTNIGEQGRGDFSWSPDSSRFAVASETNYFGGTPASLYVAKAVAPNDGKNLLPTDKDGFAKSSFSPSWSPDGTKIAFAYEYLETATSGPTDDISHHRGIYVVNADGTNFAEVTSNQSYSTNPIWLDNTTIAYGLSNIYSKGNKGVYSIKADGTANTLLYSGDFGNYTPVSLSADSQTIFFTTDSFDGTYTAGGTTYTTQMRVLDLKGKTSTLVDSSVITL